MSSHLTLVHSHRHKFHQNPNFHSHNLINNLMAMKYKYTQLLQYMMMSNRHLSLYCHHHMFLHYLRLHSHNLKYINWVFLYNYSPSLLNLMCNHQKQQSSSRHIALEKQ